MHHPQHIVNRQFPFTYGIHHYPMYPPQAGGIYGATIPNPYFPYEGTNPYIGQQSHQYHQGSNSAKTSYLFENPLQPEDGYMYGQISQSGYGNTYLPNSYIPRPSPFSSVLKSFKNQNGSIDLNKVVNTAGQLMNAFNQVSGMAKSLSGMFFKA